MMKKIALALSGAALLVAGCGKNETASGSAPEAAAAASVRTVEITGNDQMKFDVTSIEAKAGEKLRVRMTNAGTLPKVAMGHNWVLLKMDANAADFATAAAVSMQTEYIPAGKTNQIIAHTKLLGPKESDVVTFTVPETPGEYVFLCSFPGHFLAGMKGVLVVK